MKEKTITNQILKYLKSQHFFLKPETSFSDFGNTFFFVLTTQCRKYCIYSVKSAENIVSKLLQTLFASATGITCKCHWHIKRVALALCASATCKSSLQQFLYYYYSTFYIIITALSILSFSNKVKNVSEQTKNYFRRKRKSVWPDKKNGIAVLRCRFGLEIVCGRVFTSVRRRWSR